MKNMIDLFKEKHIINDNYDFLKKPIVTIPKKSLDLKIKDWYNDNSKIYLHFFFPCWIKAKRVKYLYFKQFVLMGGSLCLIKRTLKIY